MNVQPHHPVEGGLDQVCHHARSYGFPTFRPPVLSRIAQVWDQSSKPRRSRSPGGVAEEEKFDEVRIDRGAHRLNDVDVAAPDAFKDLDVLLAVEELFMVTLRESFTQPACNRLGKAWIG